MSLPDSVFVHERALVETDDVGSETRIWAFAHLLPGAKVGARCNICDHAFVEGGAILGDDVTVKNNVLVWDGVEVENGVFLGPNAVFTNDMNPRARIKKTSADFIKTKVCEGASIGANSTIVCGVEIGRHAFVGAGTVVIRDVPDYALMVGNPARQIGWMCECGEEIMESLHCSGCTRHFEKADSGLKEVL